MATGSGAFGVKPGYNQSGGSYLVCLENLWTNRKLNVYTAGTGSGGATTQGSFALESDVVATAGYSGGLNVSSFFGIGNLIKDMGKTVTSAGRTFRKIQAVAGTNANSSPTFGVNGLAATASNPGYLSYYIEIGREGANADGAQSISGTTGSLALVARYF